MTIKHTLLTLALLLALPLSAQAEDGFPSSQFGYQGWYRPEVTCPAAQAPTPTPLAPSATTHPASPTQTARPATSAAPTATKPIAVSTAQPSTGDDYTTASAQAQEEILLNLLNQERISRGLTPLTLDPALTRLARIKSNDMKANHYFAHESPTHGRVKDMLTRFGYAYVSAGENIAHHATAQKSHAAFMSSAAHRQNILNSAWKKVGIGVVYDSQGYVYVTQIFVR